MDVPQEQERDPRQGPDAPLPRDPRALEGAMGYVFEDRRLLMQALTHASHANERQDSLLRDNERLEFLGDAVLDLCVSHILMDRFEDSAEGDLSRFRALVVDESGLCQVARSLSLGDYILLGKGEEQSGGRKKPSILADTMEAILGACYLDNGFEGTREIVRRLFSPVLDMVNTHRILQDYKTLLQEFTQQKFRTLPRYVLIREEGPAHDKTFEIDLTLNQRVLARALGKSKKEAEQRAAREAYCLLTRG